MNRPRFALIVDHPQRDLAGIVLTAIDLCQRGAVCHLVSLNLQEREIWSLAPDFVLLNYFRRGNEAFARRLRSAGIRYGLLDTEGGVWADEEDYAGLLWNDASLLKGAACVCAWGPRLADHLVREGRFDRRQVTVTGCPRFDLYHPRWRSVLSNGAAFSRDERRPRVLINTLYSTVNSRLVSREANAEELERMNGWSRSRVERSLEAEDRAIEAMVELAKWLSHDFAEADIVVRPHPFESPELYQKALEGLANVSVDGDGPVQPRILGAVAVVQRSCTTAIEAGLAGVPALSPQWVPAPTVNPMSEAVSERCQTYADLKTRVRSILDATHRPSAALCTEIQTVVHDWFHRNDGRAHERVADTVARCWSGKRVVDEGLCRRYQYGLGVSPVSPVVRLGQWTRYAVGLSPNFSFRQLSRVRSRQKRVKDFGAEDALRLARRIESAQRAGGRDWRPVSVEAAADRGDYSNGFVGQSVTVACEP